jgi:hypothetical protein
LSARRRVSGFLVHLAGPFLQFLECRFTLVFLFDRSPDLIPQFSVFFCFTPIVVVIICHSAPR